ncbi:hypothetical protein IJC60_06195 [bacterium]|nr:hypothetical protein [bacterium]
MNRFITILLILLVSSKPVYSTNLNDPGYVSGSWLTVVIAFLLPIIVGYIIDYKNSSKIICTTNNKKTYSNFIEYIEETLDRLKYLRSILSSSGEMKLIYSEYNNVHYKLPLDEQWLYATYLYKFSKYENYKIFYEELYKEGEILRIKEYATDVYNSIDRRLGYYDMIGKLDFTIDYIERTFNL